MEGKNQSDLTNIEDLLGYAKSIIATLREPFLVLDKNLHIISVNHAFCATFKVTEKDTIGQLLPDLGNKQWDIPRLIHLLKEIVPEKKIVKDFEVEHEFEQIGHRVMVLNACQLRVPKKIGAIIVAGVRVEELILLAIEDITERKRLQEELEASEERYRRAFETSHDGLLLVHKTEGDILNSNDAIQGLLGYSKEELKKNNLWGIGVIKDKKEFQDVVLKLEKNGVIHFEDMSIKNKLGQNIDTEIFLIDKAKVIQCNIRNISGRKEVEDGIKRAYAGLEDKVRERTADLQKRLQELERFRKATEEREFRIKELRDEIDRLKAGNCSK